MIDANIPAFEFKSPIYRIPDGMEHHLRKYLALIPDDEDRYVFMSIVTNSLTYGLRDTDQGRDYDLLDTNQLNSIIELDRPDSSIGLGRTATNARLNRFIDLGLFVREKLKASDLPGGKGLRGAKQQYILQPIENVLAKDLSTDDDRPKYIAPKDRNKEYHKGLARSRQELVDSGAQLLDSPKHLRQAHSERLLNNVFFSCGRQSYKDPRKSRIETLYKFREEHIRIVATAGGEASLFTLEDQSTVLAIITLVILHNKERMRKGDEIKNEYYIDIANICGLCGLSPVGANRKTLRDSIDRLYHSNLNVQCPPESEFAKFFGLSSYTDNGKQFNPDNMDFRFLSQKDSVSMVESDFADKRAPRYYRISLHPLIFQQLTNPEVWNTFIVNPQLLRDRLKMVTHLYFFAARTTGRDASQARRWPIKVIQQMLMPAYDRYHNWERSLFNDLSHYAKRTNQRFEKDKESTLDLYGYFMKIKPSDVYGHTLTFWLNTNDPLIGRLAEYSRSEAKQLQLLEKTLEFGSSDQE